MRKYQIALFGNQALEKAMDVSEDRLSDDYVGVDDDGDDDDDDDDSLTQETEEVN
jgi:hypothetical protein